MSRPALAAIAAALLLAGCTVTVKELGADGTEAAQAPQASGRTEEPATTAGSRWSLPELDRRAIVLATGLDDAMVATTLLTEGFDAEPASWTIANASIDCANAREGTCSLLIPDGDSAGRVLREIDLLAGGTVEFRFAWLDEGRGIVSYQFLDARDARVGPMVSDFPKAEAGAWSDVSLGPVSVPDGATKVRLGFYGRDGQAGASRVDDLEVVHRTLPAGDLTNGGLESPDRWTLLGGARIDCEASYEGSCSLFLPRTGGAASQTFVLAGPSVMLDLLAMPSAIQGMDPGIRVTLDFYAASGEWVGSMSPSASGFSEARWLPLSFGGSSSRAHHVVASIALPPNDAGDLWIDAIQARYG